MMTYVKYKELKKLNIHESKYRENLDCSYLIPRQERSGRTK